MSAVALMSEKYQRVYTVKEVADILRVTERTIRRMITRGEIPAFTVGREYRIHQNTLDGLMRVKDEGNRIGE